MALSQNILQMSMLDNGDIGWVVVFRSRSKCPWREGGGRGGDCGQTLFKDLQIIHSEHSPATIVFECRTGSNWDSVILCGIAVKLMLLIFELRHILSCGYARSKPTEYFSVNLLVTRMDMFGHGPGQSYLEQS